MVESMTIVPDDWQHPGERDPTRRGLRPWGRPDPVTGEIVQPPGGRSPHHKDLMRRMFLTSLLRNGGRVAEVLLDRIERIATDGEDAQLLTFLRLMADVFDLADLRRKDAHGGAGQRVTQFIVQRSDGSVATTTVVDGQPAAGPVQLDGEGFEEVGDGDGDGH